MLYAMKIQCVQKEYDLSAVKIQQCAGSLFCKEKRPLHFPGAEGAKGESEAQKRADQVVSGTLPL